MIMINQLRCLAKLAFQASFLASLTAAPQLNAQISYTGGVYTQSFDALATTGTANDFTDNVTLPGWYAQSGNTTYDQNAGGAFTLIFPANFTSTADQYRAGVGDSNTGDIYSFGSANSTERAFGSVGSGTPPDFFTALAVTNDTGSPLASFTVAYDGEQWRLGGNTTQRPETVFAYYRVGGTALDGSGTWTPVPSLNFTSPNTSATTTTGAALDGNAAGNRVANINATISIPVQPGQTIWVLWVDLDDVGADHGMALDNVTFTATTATAGAPVISSSTTAVGTANSFFTYTITASGSPSSYNAADLPGWLSLNTETGVLSGTPTVPGVFPVTVSATNGIGTGSAVVTITIAADPNAPVVTPEQAISHLINTALTYQVQASNTPASYTIGALPAGLSFDTLTGVISGTPTVTATFNNVLVTATNASGTGAGTLNIAVVSAPAYTSDLTISAYAGASFNYTPVFTQTPFSFSFADLPPGLVNTSGSVISGTAPAVPGVYAVVVTATNNSGSTQVVLNIVVLDAAAQTAIPQNVVVNKFSNSDPDRVELLVVGNGAPGSTVDMRGMILKDFSGSSANDGGGRHTFASNSLWSAVPAGTLIVLSAGTTATEDLVVSDFVLAVNLGNATYFSSVGSFDIATVEMIMIKAAGTGTGGVAGGIHVLASGSVIAAQFVAFTGPKVGTTATTGFGFGAFVNNATSSLADFNGTGATGATALAALTFGAANNPTNQIFINLLRTAPLSAIQSWRQTNFGNAANTGTRADAADFDNDGIANLVEYATGTNPTVAGASVINVGRNGAGDLLTLTFNRINDPALTYSIFASNDLLTGFTSTGTTYPGNAVGAVTYTDSVSLSAPGVRRFLRLQISYTE